MSHFEIEIRQYDFIMIDGMCRKTTSWHAMATRYMTSGGAIAAARKIAETGTETRVIEVGRIVLFESATEQTPEPTPTQTLSTDKETLTLADSFPSPSGPGSDRPPEPEPDYNPAGEDKAQEHDIRLTPEG